MVAFTITPSRAAARLNSGVRAHDREMATDCLKTSARSRLGLAAFGEPQVCTTCGNPLEFSRRWKRSIFLLHLSVLTIGVLLPIPALGALKLWLILALLVSLQISFWTLAPVVHQSSAEVTRRNRVYFCLALGVLAFALIYLFWVSFQAGGL